MAPMQSPLRTWTSDIPNGDLDELMVYPDGTVLVATGRFAHSSGSARCTWDEFLSGHFDELIMKRHGASVLAEAKTFVRGAPKPP